MNATSANRNDSFNRSVSPPDRRIVPSKGVSPVLKRNRGPPPVADKIRIAKNPDPIHGLFDRNKNNNPDNVYNSSSSKHLDRDLARRTQELQDKIKIEKTMWQGIISSRISRTIFMMSTCPE